jgi:TolA-binding protein
MNNDYTTSISIFNKLKNEQLLTSETSFFLGLSYLGSEDFDNAAKIFNDHLFHYNNFQPEVKWYLGLSYLQLGEIAKAKTLFGELSNYNGKFGRKAKRLEGRLNGVME